jgi:hypothetical protein
MNVNGAGLIGVNMDGAAHFYILNCYNAGNVYSGSESGAVTGWTGGDKSTIENVYNIGKVTNGEGSGFLRGGGKLINCFERVLPDEATSGKLCYEINKGAGKFVFFQNVGEDKYPTFNGGFVASIAANGYGTFYVGQDAIAVPEGVTAYTGVISGDVLSMTEVESGEIPAATAVVLKGDEGYYSFAGIGKAAALENNDLAGNRAPLEADGSQYVLAEVEGVVGFYQAEVGTTIPFAKGFLNIANDPAPSEGVKAIRIVFGDATGIANVETGSSEKAVIYDLSGRRVEKAVKGIYIVNGKKVLK